jgi:hypothetical protein
MYLQTEFQAKMGLVVKEIALLKGRLDDHVTSIDDIVLLL